MIAFRLGRISFCVEGVAPELARDLRVLLPSAEIAGDEVHPLSAVGSLRFLLNQILGCHDDCIWIDAAYLVSPMGKSLLIAGKSGAGKSTTAISLVFEYGWTALAEDLVLIDPRRGEVITFASPFSLKVGTLDLLKKTIQRVPQNIVLDEWVPNEKAFGLSGQRAHVDVALYFETAGGGEQLSVDRLNAGNYMRLILPNSNLVHHEHFTERMADYLANATCHKVSGGDLRERLDLILNIVHQPTQLCSS